jgi:hypothetical protein
MVYIIRLLRCDFPEGWGQVVDGVSDVLRQSGDHLLHVGRQVDVARWLRLHFTLQVYCGCGCQGLEKPRSGRGYAHGTLVQRPRLYITLGRDVVHQRFDVPRTRIIRWDHTALNGIGWTSAVAECQLSDNDVS